MKVHFIGIGGIGMSSLARHFLEHGIKVSGSDLNKNKITNELEKDGVEVFIGHSTDNLDPKSELVIFSDAIPSDNPEIKKAKELKIKSRSYFAQLGEISKNFETTIIAGTHGKSTTSAMLSQVLIENNKNPTVFLGTLSNVLDGKNYRAGDKIAIVEACEYKENFLNLHPQNMLFLNAEPEHLDFFKTEEKYFRAFWKLAPKVKKGGFIAANLETMNVGSIIARLAAEGDHDIVSYGEKEGVHFRGEYKNSKSLKILDDDNDLICEIFLKVPGWHNRQNALAAFVAAKKLGIKTKDIKKSLENFTGTWRRLERKGEKNGVVVFDDYAHHPTEVKASLSALSELFPENKIVCIFQPHQFSRTYEFLNEFGKSFSDADEVIIPNIYKVRDSEEDLKKVSAEDLVQEIQKNEVKAKFLDGFSETLKYLKKDLKKGDVFVTMGAGDVYEIAEGFLE